MKIVFGFAILCIFAVLELVQGRPSDKSNLERELTGAIEINGEMYVKQDSKESSKQDRKQNMIDEDEGKEEKKESKKALSDTNMKQVNEGEAEKDIQAQELGEMDNDGAGGEEVVEGDIIVSTYIKDLRAGKLDKRAIHKKAGRWTGHKYYYQLHSSLTSSMKDEVRLAIRMVDRAGCLEFIEKADPSGYVLFQKSKTGGCNSFIGKTGEKPQPINVAEWCKAGSLAHEILHSIGFLHEQTRPDRDQYVTITLENVKKGMEHNFKKYPHPVVELFKEPYDYKSIMQYPRTAFSKNGKETITPKDSSVTTLGQREGLTDKDKTLLRKYYNCKKCENEGWGCGARVFLRMDSCQRGRSSCLGSCDMWCKT